MMMCRKARTERRSKPKRRSCRFTTRVTRWSKRSPSILWLVCGNQSFRIMEDIDAAYIQWMRRQLKIAIRANNESVRKRP